HTGLAGHAVQAQILVLAGFGAWLERLVDRRAAALGRQPAIWVDAVEPQARRDAELGRRGVFQGGDHKVAEDRRRDPRGLLAAAEARMVVIPDIDAGGEV